MVYKKHGNGRTNSVDIEIDDGEFVFLVGPPLRKTTIIKLLTGEVTATDGEIVVNGFDLRNIKQRRLPRLRRTLGVIFTGFPSDQ
jgi:cell division transport system ATP-binding protein